MAAFAVLSEVLELVPNALTSEGLCPSTKQFAISHQVGIRARNDSRYALTKSEPQVLDTFSCASLPTTSGKFLVMMLYHALVQSVHSTLLGMLGTDEETT